jgi:long-chain acyl-CoA synthetase
MSNFIHQEEARYRLLTASFRDGADLLYAGTLLERAARQFPKRTALIISEKEQLTYEQLYQRATAVSAYLTEQGVTLRDRVMLLYENSINFYVAYFGIWQTGAVVVPLNTFLHEKELAYVISDAQPKALLVSNELAKKIALIDTPLPLIITEDTLNEIAQKPLTQPYTARKLDLDEMCALLYTSGTTGLPKGVMLSSRNIIINIIQGASRFQITDAERIYCALPLFHVFMQNTCVWASTAIGATVIIVPKIGRQTLLAGLALKPTIMLGVPGLYALLCRFKTAHFDTVRYCVSGGDAMVDKIRMYFELLYNRKICNGYGLSETSPFISIDLDDTVSPTSTVGRPCIGVQTEIRGGSPIGVLWLKGPNIMLGYYNAPEATAKVLVDGWFNTGDLARIDATGKIVICGREKDLIANKGRKIYPQEVENILMAHPYVMMAAVIGVPDETEGEYPIAYVTLKEPLPDAEKVLIAFCKQHLAVYKIPRQFMIVDQLPLTATGKVDKKELKKIREQK